VLLARLLRRGLRPIGTWQEVIFFERDLAEDAPDIRAALPLDLHVVTAADLPAFRPALEAAGVDWPRMAARAALGHRCTVALSNGRLVHLRWLSEGPAWIPELRATITPEPGEAYVYDSFTPEEARGGGVQPAVSSLMMAWGRRQGFRRHVFYVRGNNAAGLRIVKKVGARRTAVVRCLRPRFGGGAWVTGWRPGGRPRLDFGPGPLRSLGPFGLWVGAPPR
jgi:ribosomal protein S18 acetylase RimI-like enzyme